MVKFTFLILTICYFSLTALSQDHQVVQLKFGSGLRFTSPDSSFYIKFSARMQNRYDGEQSLTSGVKYQDRFYVRRARLKFDGYALSPKLVYKIEIDVVSGQMLDAVVKWDFYKGFTLWFGQTKLAGNRERVISSQNLQFVDRSLLNSGFNIDRDKGIQLWHEHSAGSVLFREVASISMGEGRNQTSFSMGHDYTARFEILPMGKFTKKGDYVSADIYREQKPKLALGATFDYNNNSIRRGGQLGKIFTESRDLMTWFADMMFKYKGLSIMGEFAHKTSDESPVIDSTQSFYTGRAINAQAGYVFKKNWEIAGRFTCVKPEKETPYAETKEYTVAISRYILNHSLKVQTDFSYKDVALSDGLLIWRFQVELSF